MDTLLIVAGVMVVALLAVVLRALRSSPKNLGFVSRDWVMKHSTDHTGV